MSTQSLRHQVASEVRAEMARQQRTGVELAAVLNCSQQSVSRKLNGGRGLSLDEIPLIAEWLDVPVMALISPRSRTDERASA